MFDNVVNLMVAGLSTTLLLGSVIALYYHQYFNSVSKKRFSRALRQNKRDRNAVLDLPSIARQRYAFMKNRQNNGGFIASYITYIEDLIFASGLKMSLPTFLLGIFLLILIVALLLNGVVGLSLIGAMPIALPAAIYLALQILVRLRARKLHRFQEIFPEALDLIVRSVRAGLPVSESMKMIGTEVADPVGDSFREVASNLAIGMSLDETLSSLQRKVPVPEVKFFAISLTIQQETGGNLAEILSNLAAIMRKRVQIGKKIRALSSEARASALIIGSLPFIVGLAIYVLNREYIEVLFVDDLGRLFLFGALGSMGAGAIVMSRLIRFEI
jgi:tight adherence protein B